MLSASRKTETAVFALSSADVNEVLINIREWLSSHPQNQGWKNP